MKLNASISKLAAAVCTVAAFFSISTAAIAGPITVANYSFEGPVQVGNGFNNPSGITSWVTTGAETAVWNPALTFSVFSPPTPYFSTAIPDGVQIGYSNAGTIAQTLTATYESGYLYNLTVAVGLRNFVAGPGQYIPATATMELFAGTTANIIASLPIPVSSIARGTFQDFTLSVAGGAWNGQAIGILFTSGGEQLDIDNVRLNSVPEPGTLILLGGALAGIGVVRRRKQA